MRADSFIRLIMLLLIPALVSAQLTEISEQSAVSVQCSLTPDNSSFGSQALAISGLGRYTGRALYPTAAIMLAALLTGFKAHDRFLNGTTPFTLIGVATFLGTLLPGGSTVPSRSKRYGALGDANARLRTHLQQWAAIKQGKGALRFVQVRQDDIYRTSIHHGQTEAAWVQYILEDDGKALKIIDTNVAGAANRDDPLLNLGILIAIEIVRNLAEKTQTPEEPIHVFIALPTTNVPSVAWIFRLYAFRLLERHSPMEKGDKLISHGVLRRQWLPVAQQYLENPPPNALAVFDKSSPTQRPPDPLADKESQRTLERLKKFLRWTRNRLSPEYFMKKSNIISRNLWNRFYSGQGPLSPGQLARLDRALVNAMGTEFANEHEGLESSAVRKNVSASFNKVKQLHPLWTWDAHMILFAKEVRTDAHAMRLFMEGRKKFKEKRLEEIRAFAASILESPDVHKLLTLPNKTLGSA